MGRWEYKADDDAIVLHAGPDGAGDVLLVVDLLASSDDASDWQVNATVVLPVEQFRQQAVEVARTCSAAKR